MEGDRVKKAIERIEAAASRIDAAGQLLSQGPGDDQKLLEENQALRNQISQTLTELDQLIEGLEP